MFSRTVVGSGTSTKFDVVILVWEFCVILYSLSQDLYGMISALLIKARNNLTQVRYKIRVLWMNILLNFIKSAWIWFWEMQEKGLA